MEDFLLWGCGVKLQLARIPSGASRQPTMLTKLLLVALILPGKIVHANDGASREIFFPTETSLWRVADDGSAKRQSFRFVESVLNAGHEAKLSPDHRLLAFTRAGNVWTLDPINGACKEISRFQDCDPKATGCQMVTLYGWTPDGKNIAISTIVGEYGPGEGEPPPEFTSLDSCTSVIRQKVLLQDKSQVTGSVPNGTYLLGVADSSLEPFKGTEGEIPKVYADGAYSGVAKSPDGKHSAEIIDPYGGKSELQVDGKPVLPGTKVRRFSWITDRAIVALSLGENSKTLDITIVRVSDLKKIGEYAEARRTFP